MKRKIIIILVFSFLCRNANSQEEYNITSTSEDGSPTFITFNNNSDVTHLNFREKLSKEFKIRKEDEFFLIKTTTDKLGFTQFKYNQTYNGITVFGAQYIILEKNNLVTSANGKFISNLEINTNPTITSEEAIKSAMSTIGLNKYRWEDEKSEQAIKSRTKNKNASHYPKPELLIAPIDGNYKNGKFCLCWKFNIAGLSLSKAWTVFIDAQTGELINKISMIADDVPATATTLYNGNQSIKCKDDTSVSGYYLLSENQRGTSANQSIYTWDANNDTIIHVNGNVPAATTQIGSVSTSFTSDLVANSVHWGIEKSYDFYSLFSRKSYDDNGSYILNLVHYNDNLNNAFWSGNDNVMCYGDGDGSLMNPVVGLDVTGHEFSHAVTQYSADLQYQGESGALNESFSDIFGTGIEWYTLGIGSNWTIGENVIIQSSHTNRNYFRSMSNPNAGLIITNGNNVADLSQPDTYLGNLWASTGSGSSDYGGVHTNSGVQNFWFYLLASGGSGVNDNGTSYSVTGIGMSDALNVAYRNLIVYLNQTSDYSDARLGSIQAATDFWGAGSKQVESVISAWCAVGLGDCSAGVTIARTAGSNPSCTGSSVTFSATSKNGGTSPSYQWKINGVNNGLNNSMFTTSSLVNGQQITCVVTSNFSGVINNPATSNGITMSINPIPLTPQVIVLNNCGSSQLSTNATGILHWSTGASTTSITTIIPGVNTVTQTVGGCTSAIGSGIAAPLSVPLKPTISQNGKLLTSSSSTGNQWYLNGAIINGANQQTFLAQQSGSYYVKVTNTNNCYSQSSSVLINFAGVDEVNENSIFTIFPNPFNGELNIQFSELVNIANVEVYDISGRQVYNKIINNTSSDQPEVLKLENLSTGMYNLRIEINGNISNYKIIKE